MTISSTTRAAILDLVFLATTWANYAINATSSPQTSIAVGLHEADPGIGGTMATSEATYGSYARQDKLRTAAGWTRTSNSISPAASILFPVGTGAGGTLTHFSTGKTGGGAAPILWYGSLTPNIPSGSGIQPELLAASTISLT